MATSKKAAARPTVKHRTTSKGATRPKPTAKEAPFLRFHHSDELRAKTLAVLAALEHAPDPGKHRGDLADVVVELTNAGLDFYFMRPLAAAKAGFVIQQSANLGLAGSRQVIGSVIRGIIGRMDGPQVLSICGSIRELMA